MTEAIFTPMAGALGDMLTYYLEGELGYFSALRSMGVHTKVKAWSVSDQAGALFAPNINIDEFEILDFAPAAGRTHGFRDWAARGEAHRLMTDVERQTVPWVQPTFYLADNERRVADAIEAAGPFVAVHPFAGKPERSLARQGLARPLVNAIADTGANVVVLGGNSQRNGLHRMTLIENFDDDRPNVTSLVNKGFSVRLHAHLASRATRFVGTVSAYNCVAEHFKIPSLIFGSAQNRIDMQNGGAVFEKMRRNGTFIYYLDNGPNVAGLAQSFCTGVAPARYDERITA